ncbi:MAG: metallophosphoesterase [Candidatus Brocadia sp.]|nr:metallophosphoesterase [Candidatus Brocadia sp.]NUO08183.1 metallophosphoesterase [Candidatus Brocadia sp.]
MLRIVHLSDLHISEEPTNYIPSRIAGLAGSEVDALKRLKKAANKKKQSHKLIPPSNSAQCVVSGDLSATGKPAEFSNALTFLQQQLIIAGGQLNVGLSYGIRNFHAVLGNHDIWGSRSSLLAWYLPNKKKEKALHSLGISSHPRCWKVFKKQSDYACVGRFIARLYLLDSTLPGLRNVIARGRVDQRQLDTLSEMVAKDEMKDSKSNYKCCLRIAVLHHPISPIERHKFKMFLENQLELETKLKDLKFGMVLCGHEHKCKISPLSSSGIYQCMSGSATQTTRERKDNSFYVYDIEDDSNCPNPEAIVRITRYERVGTQGVEFSPIEEPPIKPLLAQNETETKTSELDY